MNPSSSWQIEETTEFALARKWYEKKRKRELEAVINNLSRYFAQLCVAKNPRCVQAGYIHPEASGSIALDQSAGGGNLQETRLYVFPDTDKRVLYLITIGNKNEQQDDNKLVSRFVERLKERSA